MNRLRLILICSSVLIIAIPIVYFATKYNDRPIALPPKQALENVLSIRTKYFYTTSLAAASKPSFDRMLQNAAHGNMNDLRGFYEVNCPKGH